MAINERQRPIAPQQVLMGLDELVQVLGVEGHGLPHKVHVGRTLRNLENKREKRETDILQVYNQSMVLYLWFAVWTHKEKNKSWAKGQNSRIVLY